MANGSRLLITVTSVSGVFFNVFGVRITVASTGAVMRVGKLDSRTKFWTMWGAEHALNKAFNDNVHWHPSTTEGVQRGYVESSVWA